MLFRRNLYPGAPDSFPDSTSFSRALPLTDALRKRFFSRHDLREAVQTAQHDTATYRMIRRQATGILTHLGLEDIRANAFFASIEGAKIKDLGRFEAELHDLLAKDTEIYDMLPVRMEERACMCFNLIAPYLQKSETVLDLGGGSGEVARLMQAAGCNVTIADVLNWNKTNLPFVRVRNNKAALPDGSFDTVVVLTVFHHSDDPSALVAEAFRLAKKRVIFIESVTENALEFSYGAWIDWFYNRVIHYSSQEQNKINVPLHFLPSHQWEELVRTLTALEPSVSQNLGIYQWLNPEHHHLFVYEKQ